MVKQIYLNKFEIIFFLVLIFQAFCQSCQSYIKNKFNSIDVNHNGKITLKELLNQAGKAPFENKTVEDLTRLVSLYFS